MIACDKKFVGAELGRAVEIDRVDRLVGRQCDDFFDLLIDARVDHVFRPDHVGLDALDRIVLGDRNMLERGSMDDDINTCERTVKALGIANVADEKTQHIGREFLLHLKLFKLVARINHKA